MKHNHLNYIELSKSALDKNIASLAQLAGKKMVAVSVKGNAYGHGLPEIVGLLKDNSQVNYLTTHTLEEAIICRESGWKKNILILGPVAHDKIEAIADLCLEPAVFDLAFLEALGKFSDKYKIGFATHLKLETGTNRFGITEKELPRFIKAYKKYKLIGRPYGAYTHFANIEDTTDHSYAESQLKIFKQLLAKLKSSGVMPKIKHTASSAATILFDKTHFDMVRPGIAAYGYWPSKETYLSYRLEGGSNSLFQPLLSWKTKIGQVKNLAADSFIGYGCTYRTTAKTKLAVLPVGYYDGFDRRLSNLAYVLIKGKRSPVRGRVCMNITMVDISDISNVKAGAVATLLGVDGKEKIDANMWAGWCGSINYEIISRISPEIKRILVK